MMLPSYFSPKYSNGTLSNLQQNNATPLLPYGRPVGGNYENTKSVAFTSSIQPPIPNNQLTAPLCEYMPTNYSQHCFRPHPYSVVRRSSSSTPQHIPASATNTVEGNSYANNHSTNEQPTTFILEPTHVLHFSEEKSSIPTDTPKGDRKNEAHRNTMDDDNQQELPRVNESINYSELPPTNTEVISK